MAARDISRSRRAAGAIPRAVLFLCRRPRGDEIFAAGGTQAAIPPRLELSARRRRRQRRSCILGSAFTADREAAGHVPEAEQIAGKFDRAGVVLGGDNETVLKRAGWPADRARSMAPNSVRRRCFSSRTITTISTTTRRRRDHHVSANVFHACARPRHAAACTIPEFLPDVGAPAWPAVVVGGRSRRWRSESFGTMRYGQLAEVLLYDIRRTATLAGPSAVYVDPRSRNG